MSEAVLQSSNDKDIDDEEEQLFEMLNEYYTTNPMITREFAKFVNDRVLFGPDVDPSVRQITGKEFLQIMKKSGPFSFMLVRPVALRERFTEFVLTRRELALEAPSSMFSGEDAFHLEMSRRSRKGKLKQNESFYSDKKGTSSANRSANYSLGRKKDKKKKSKKGNRSMASENIDETW